MTASIQHLFNSEGVIGGYGGSSGIDLGWIGSGLRWVGSRLLGVFSLAGMDGGLGDGTRTGVFTSNATDGYMYSFRAPHPAELVPSLSLSDSYHRIIQETEFI